jgi:hypothetical protein
MNKRLNKLIKNIKGIFSPKLLDKISRKIGFIKRNDKIDTSTFLAFNILLSSFLRFNFFSDTVI